MRKLSTIFTLLAILVIGGLVITGRWNRFISALNPSPTPVPVTRIEYTTPSPNVTYSFMAETAGQTAFDLLQSKAEIEYDTYTAGPFVTAINGLKADSQHYWAFYLNGEYAHQGIGQTVLQVGDEVTFTYEEITATQE